MMENLPANIYLIICLIIAWSYKEFHIPLNAMQTALSF